MNTLKRILPLLLCLVLVLGLSACGSSNAVSSSNEETSKPSEAAQPSDKQTDQTGTTANNTENAGSTSENENAYTPAVYFTSDISPEGLARIYEQLGWEPTGKLAVKVSTGEPPASNYLRQDLIGELVGSLGGTYVECMTAYGGRRASIASAKQVAADHGFTPFDLLDENGSMTLSVANYSVISENYVGAGMANYDSMLVLSHFKGHQMAGFGGAIKNISIGLGSAEGKAWIHSGGKSKSNPWGGDQTAFTESMAEAASTVQAYYGDKIIYINVMNRLSIDCDCNGNPAEPDIHDIGILASFDPVALDQACIDLVWNAEGSESLVRRIESRDGLHTLEHAEEIGLGSRTYTLIDIDD